MVGWDMVKLLGSSFVLFFLLACGGMQESVSGLKLSTNLQSAKIIGGVEVGPSDQLKKHTVLINAFTVNALTETKPSIISMCTGIVIGKRSILTAAHCLPQYLENPKKYNVMEIIFTTDSSVDESLKIFATKMIPHPSYLESKLKDFDLSIVHLANDIPAGYEPVMFLPNAIELKLGESLTALGFGVKVEESLNTNTHLNKVTGLPILEDLGTVLIVDQSQGKGICSGDSGGPAFYFYQGLPYLAGINQGSQFPIGVVNNKCRQTGVMVKIQTFKTWIQKNIL
jgi:secreted trypsin-like serine protease